jgi:hypothetical protein
VCERVLFPRPVPRPLRLHDTRHTAATLMLAAGVDLFAVAKFLRHKDARVTSSTEEEQGLTSATPLLQFRRCSRHRVGAAQDGEAHRVAIPKVRDR